MLDAAERDLFVKAVGAAVDKGDEGLAEIGWGDALEADDRLAVSVWFEAQGAALATSSALGLVVGAPLRRERGGIDPTFGRVTIVAPSEPALAAGRRAVAHELLGVSRSMLELAREHALARVQFGVPIASFQAVRHRLAEAYVAIEASVAALDGAWDDRRLFAATAAKATAGRGARIVARHSQQVLAGIGFTAEHSFHTFFRRSLVLDNLLGDYPRLSRQIGEELLATRALPALPAL